MQKNKRRNIKSKSLSVLLMLCTFYFITGCSGPQSMLEPAGPAAFIAAQLWWGMAILFGVVFLAVLILWLIAVRPKKQPAHEDKVSKMGLRLLWGGGVILPMVSIILILSYGIPAGYHMLPHSSMDENPLRVNVIGHQWWWEIHYPETGVTLVNEFHLPVGKPVDVYASSKDVIHSIWVPRLNGKVDLIPGHTNVLRLLAAKAGHYRGQCAEFCGEQHALMILNVQAQEPEEFRDWLIKQSQKNALSSELPSISFKELQHD